MLTVVYKKVGARKSFNKLVPEGNGAGFDSTASLPQST